MTMAMLHEDVILNIFRMNEINIFSIKERVKWACVCKTWSSINMKWLKESHNEACLFSNSLMKRLYETQDLSSIVNSMRKHYWHHVYGASCLSQIQTFLSSQNLNCNYYQTIENEYAEEDNFGDEESVNNEDEQNSNVYYVVADGEMADYADYESDIIEFEVKNNEFSIKEMVAINILRKEQENKSIDVMKLGTLENFDSTMSTYAYEMKKIRIIKWIQTRKMITLKPIRLTGLMES